MKKTAIAGPFGAPVYHIEETDSTMHLSRELAGSGAPHGTTVWADFQNAGRGRIEGRSWTSAPGENILCTVMLRCHPVPGFTLRVGLAVALAFDAFLPPGIRTEIKWPNDVLFGGKKLAGILCENDGSVIHVGTGLNVGQTGFPPELTAKATSLARILANLAPASTASIAIPSREDVLAAYLSNLESVLGMDDWNTRVSDKLWRRGERIRFLSGDPAKREILDGAIEGIGPAGELLFRPAQTAAEGSNASRGAGAAGIANSPLLRLFSGEIPYPE